MTHTVTRVEVSRALQSDGVIAVEQNANLGAMARRNTTLEKVGIADEAGHEFRRRPVIEILVASDLDDPAAPGRHVENGDTQPIVQLADPGLDLLAELLVQCV